MEAWAVEMVFVPAGAFELGDDHEGVRATGAFHQLGEDGQPDGLFRVASEAAIDVTRDAGGL